MTNEEKRIIEILSRDWAERYQVDHRRGPGAARQLLSVPQEGLKFLLREGFARAGAEQARYGIIAVQALDDSVIACEAYDTLVKLDNAPEMVWERFAQICISRGFGLNQKLNEGVVKGLVVLAQDSVDLNPFKHVASRILTNAVEAFLLLRSIRGIADKIAPFILRDMSTMLDVEERVAPEDRILFQPIDRWVGGIARFLWNDLGQRAPSWVIALRIIARCREYGCSPARFNQGAWKYGSSVIQDTREIPQGVRKLLS